MTSTSRFCIVQGQATCIVEGRQYTLSGCATAMVPRGRIHYFINESNAPTGHDLGLRRPVARTIGCSGTLQHNRGKSLEGWGDCTMNGQNKQNFQVVLTADFFDADGSAKYRDLGLSVFDDYSHIHHHTFAEHRPQIGSDQIGDAQGVIVLTPGSDRSKCVPGRQLVSHRPFWCRLRLPSMSRLARKPTWPYSSRPAR